MRSHQNIRSFALCIDDGGMDDLEARKVYALLPDRDATGEGLVRVIDESGEDYLYPADLFVPLRLPASVARRLNPRTETRTAAQRRRSVPRAG